VYLTTRLADGKIDSMSFKLPTPESIELPDPLVIENNRRMTGAEKLAQVFALNRNIRQRHAQSIKAQHPDWSESQVTQEVARRMSHGAE
jgi:hypothetical protein